jgi:hypothetical protein
MIEVIRSRVVEHYIKLNGCPITDYVMKGKWLYDTRTRKQF